MTDVPSPPSPLARVSGLHCRAGAEPLVQQLLERWPAEAIDQAVLVTDADTVIVAVNAGAERIFAWPAASFVGAPLAAIFTDRDRALGLDAQEIAVARRLGASEDDRWHRRRDGSRFWSAGALRALHADDADGGERRLVGFVKMLRDRTDLRAQLETMHNRLVAADRRAADDERALVTLSHELRNPLQAIGSAAQVLRRTSEPAATARLHVVVDRQIDIIGRLLGDALEAPRQRAGLRFEPRSIVLQDVLREAVDALRDAPAAEGRALELIVPEPPIVIEADSIRLQQVVANLLGNACKYTAPGGHIWVTATVEGSEAVFRVRDDGIGIAHDVQPRVFEMFTREARAGAAEVEGFGIGLAVVKDLVELHRGSVEVVSAGVGGGTEFSVNLPLVQEAASADPAVQPQSHSSAS